MFDFLKKKHRDNVITHITTPAHAKTLIDEIIEARIKKARGDDSEISKEEITAFLEDKE